MPAPILPAPILVVNAGSSSLKFSVYLTCSGAPVRLLDGAVSGLGGAPRFDARAEDGRAIAPWQPPDGERPGHDAVFERLLEWLVGWLDTQPETAAPTRSAAAPPFAAVGHRVVHGGERFAAPTRLDADVVRALEALVPLAPLHQPHNLAPIRRLAARWPSLPQVAAFDTAFHRTIPPVAQLFALPRALTAAGVRRYGFHGLSYAYIARRLRALDPVAAAGRVVVAHLGNGASLCAMCDGRSIDSSMGFTAVDGLMMGTRTGSLDPGVILWLIQEKGYDAAALERLLYKESGLRGVSGIGNDMRTLLASDHPHAAEAIDLFVYRIVREVGALTAVLGGLDALVFTAGIGENAPPIRARVTAGLGWLGARLDAAANQAGALRIAAPDSRVGVWVIPTDEDLMIATDTLELIGPDAARA